MSKYRPAVVLEEKSTKDAMRTMGPAKVEMPSPDKYLKKHSKEPKLPKSEFSYKTNWHMCVCVCLRSVSIFTCSFRDTVFKRGPQHLCCEETSRPCEDRQPTYGHSHQERLYKDSYSCANEAPAYLCGHQQGTQAAPGEFRTSPQVHQEKGIFVQYYTQE